MKQFEEFIRFFIGMIIGLFVGPIIVGYMILLIAIDELKRKKEKKLQIKLLAL